MKKVRQSGITLIALVITVIVLLILAGVSIQMLSGQNGILKRAKESKEKTTIAELKENIELEIMDELVENSTGSIDKGKLREILVRYFGEENVPTENDSKWDKFPEGFIFKTDEGYEIDIAEIYDESLGKMAAGTVTTVPEGKEWKDTVTPVADGEGNVIPVPKGFKYLEGTKDTGFVITDEEKNEFVWVPCGENGKDYQTDITVWRNNESYKSVQYSYTSEGYGTAGDEITADKWKDDGGNTTSVQTYEGFYVGRYEAGLPLELTGETYDNITTGVGNGRNVTIKDGKELKPVSKKGNPSWNFVNQKTSKTASENMYKGNSYVTSQLIDRYAWDTIVEWMQTGLGAINSTVDSKDYGNYIDSITSIPSNELYAVHLFGSREGLLVANRYSSGPWMRDVVKETEGVNANNIEQYIAKYTSWKKLNENLREFGRNDFKFDTSTYIGRVEIATGASEDTKIKNIYDMAGNMWEWTTEESTNGRVAWDSNPCAVLRGGSFEFSGSEFSLVTRYGAHSCEGNFPVDFSFRVVLYIQ